MEELSYINEETGLEQALLEQAMDRLTREYGNVKRVLLIPPDYTRCHSYAGEITRLLYRRFSKFAQVHVMPAVGTHMPMSREEQLKFFGEEIPEHSILAHRWQSDTVMLGEIPSSVTKEISQGLYAPDIEVEATGFSWMDCRTALEKYPPGKLQEGWNRMEDGEEIYFIGTPGMGLWKYGH